jgi:hypothetical protein
MTRDAEPGAAAQPGSCCDAFVEAREQLFVECRDERFYLADRQGSAQGAAGGGWTVLYGPEIAFCPFCATSLVPDAGEAGG